MIRVTFLYPKTAGGRFDMDYYLNQHLKLSKDVFGEALKNISIDRGLSGIEPGTEAPFHAIANLTFDSVESFYAALMPRIEELKSDVPKYTDSDTIIQISSVDA